jgi:hypothetical protein
MAPIDRIEDIDIWTCDGREHWPVYRVRTASSSVKTNRGDKSSKPTISI